MSLTGVKMKYHSPAYPPTGIHLNWVYEIGMDAQGMYISDGNLSIRMSFDEVKELFRPTNYHSWVEVESFLFPKVVNIPKVNITEKTEDVILRKKDESIEDIAKVTNKKHIKGKR